MFGLFKKKKSLVLYDLNGEPLADGDKVVSLRYELGECILVKTAEGYQYKSVAEGNVVSWLRMIDAATQRQKVIKKIGDNPI